MLKKYLHYDNILVFLCAWVIFSGAACFLYKINIFSSLLTFVGAFLVFIAYGRFIKKNDDEEEKNNNKNKLNKKIFFLHLAHALLIIGGFILLIISRTDDAIISPWQVIPKYFFILYFLTSLVLVIIAIKFNNKKLFILSLILQALLTVSVSAVIYKINYGYDPLIHQAAERYIATIGPVLPKTPYYAGQYGLIASLQKLFFIPVELADKWLTPLMFALFVPYYLFIALKKYFQEKIAALSSVALFALPLYSLTFTVPQSFAYIFLIIQIAKTITLKNKSDLIIIFLLALAGLSIHPLVGIPALFLAIFGALIYFKINKITPYIITAILSALSFPAMILLATGKNIAFNFNNLFASLKLSALFYSGSENIYLNTAYLYSFNFKYIFVALALAGIIFYVIRQKKYSADFSLLIFPLISGAMLLAYIFSSVIIFPDLIEQEKNNYAVRALILAGFFITPLVLFFIGIIINKINKERILNKIIFILFFIIILTCALYSSYPRHDYYLNFRGYSSGRADFIAVGWINDNAQGEPYIALANQQVSVAALNKFNFQKYFIAKKCPDLKAFYSEEKLKCEEGKTQIFYYPIPTGSLLYQYYLDASYNGTDRKKIDEAMDLAGVKLAYFVINNYWDNAKDIIEGAKLNADAWQNIDNKVFIFKYKKLF